MIPQPPGENNSPAPSWRLVPFSEEHGPLVCGWRYPAPYNVYDWPDWTELVRRGDEFADEELRRHQYVAAVDADGVLVGFGQLFPLVSESGTPIVRLGLGLRPDLCGGGRGVELTRLLVLEARRRSPGCTVDLEVLTWNIRATRAYEKAGFRISDTYVRDTPTGPAEFHCMVSPLHNFGGIR
ncbi:GNAT family N-acetyltransferase [Paenibacillus chartarius]|uniref:GNAT family N-acetyltransferase n=1 Tax=Paenibacillus chartarius TaxID=747481 RepID=A0ABV6DSC4_9BACL